MITILKHSSYIMHVPVVLKGPDMDPHRWIYNRFRRHVCEDLEGARHLQECQDEEEGNENVLLFYDEYEHD